MALENQFGMPAQAVAILMIIFGILIIVLPQLLPWLVGILLIILGVLWLVGSPGVGTWMHRTTTGPGEPPRRV
jgi:hypothetical protein